jgi:hypothetical protein
MVDSVLQTAGDVLDALGGNAAVEELTGCKPSRVCNWRSFGKFPPKFYLLMTAALAKKKKRAPASLWGMTEPADVGAPS